LPLPKGLERDNLSVTEAIIRSTPDQISLRERPHDGVIASRSFGSKSRQSDMREYDHLEARRGGRHL